jgi:Carboxypeptidase regulatory-like domain
VDGHFTILNPCSKHWSDLGGDGRKRFCDECNTYVHALDHYSLEEFQGLKRESPGRVCGLLAGESLPEPRSRRAVLVGALLTAISPLIAQSGRVRIRVIEAIGAVVPGAEASLLGPDDKPTRTEQSNEEGEVIFTDLPIGDSRLMVNRQGFRSLTLTVTVQNSEEVRVDAKLEVAVMREFVQVLPQRPKRRWWHIFH